MNTTETRGLISFAHAIPGMVKNVWPGAWVLFAVVTVAIYVSDPGLQFMTLDEWLTTHILTVIGLLALTVAIYNILDRMLAAMLTLAAWLLVASICFFAEAFLRVAAGG